MKQIAEESKISLNVNNSGSKFLGPQQASISYSTSFLPFHQTTFDILTDIEFDELKFVGFEH